MLGALCRPHGVRRVPDAGHPEEGLDLEAVRGHAGPRSAPRRDVQGDDAPGGAAQKQCRSCGAFGCGSRYLRTRWR